MSKLIEFTTTGKPARPIFVMAHKIISFMPANGAAGTLVFADSGVTHHVSNHFEDVKLLIELTLGGE